MAQIKILVPVDFNYESIIALKYAANFAKTIRAKITCLHVLEEPGFIFKDFITQEIDVKLRRQAVAKLSQKTNEILKDKNIPFEIIVTKGKVFNAILDKINSTGTGLIIMGKSDSSGLKHKIAGTNTNHIISKAHIPVITVRNENINSLHHLILPLDLTKPVRAKVENAIETTRLLDAKITLFTVLHKDYHHAKQKMESRQLEIKKIIEDQCISCQTVLIISSEPVYKALNNFALNNNADLIFLMTQQEVGFIDYFVGSTAHEIINKSEVPVLSITPEVKRQEKIQNESYINYLNDPVNLFHIH